MMRARSTRSASAERLYDGPRRGRWNAQVVQPADLGVALMACCRPPPELCFGDGDRFGQALRAPALGNVSESLLEGGQVLVRGVQTEELVAGPPGQPTKPTVVEVLERCSDDLAVGQQPGL